MCVFTYAHMQTHACVFVCIYMCVQLLINVFSYISKAEINAKCLPQFLSTVCVETVLFNEPMLTDSDLLAVPASPQ